MRSPAVEEQTSSVISSLYILALYDLIKLIGAFHLMKHTGPFNTEKHKHTPHMQLNSLGKGARKRCKVHLNSSQ